ncbi:hypothetical protein D3C76_1089130 [compost metagenome]
MALPMNRETIAAAVMYGRTGYNISNVRPLTEPASQNSTSCNPVPSSTRMACVNEANNAEIAVPASTILIGVRPSRPREPSAYTIAAATAAPAKPNHIMVVSEDTDNTTIAMTIKKIAPALIPNTLGDASGLRVNACISPPATAKLAPTTAAITVRGNRSVSRTTCSTELSS